jgi:endoglucanase
MLKQLLLITSILIFVLFSGSCNKASKSGSTKFAIRTGVNVSHWLSQSDARGADRLNYITKADFDTIAAMDFDHVRIPVDEVQLWDSLGQKENEGWALLHNAIKWALQANLRVIVDLHIIRSHYFIAANNPLWTDPAEQEKLVELWRQLSAELIQYPNDKLAYEILNEAVADNPDDWNNLFNKVLTEIRAREPDRKVVIGSNRWQIPDTFPDLKIPENDRNIILSFHFYAPMALTHHLAAWSPIAEYSGAVNYPGWIVDTLNYRNLSAATVVVMRNYANGYFDHEVLTKIMSPAIRVAREKNLPLYCGEYGVYPTIPEELRLRWYSDVCSIFNENKIAYSHWCYKGDFPVVDKQGARDQKLVVVLTAP